MQKTLLLGLPGSGKTTKILEQFTAALREGAGPVLIVPTLEHASRVTDILFQQFDVQGLFNPEQKILTFDKYARLQQAADQSGTPATEMLKVMLIRNVLQEQTLNYFSEVQHTKGFVRSLMELFAELKRSLVYPEDLRQIRSSAEKELTEKQQQKLNEIIDIYQGYEEMLKAKKLVDDQDLLPLLIKEKSTKQKSSTGIPACDYIRNSSQQKECHAESEIFIDGFYEFTPAQEELIRLLSQNSNVTVSLPCRKEELAVPMFRHLRKAYDFLVDAGFTSEILNGNSRTAQPSLVHITENLFKSTAPVLKTTDSSLSMLSGNDVSGEIRQIARHVKKLVAENDFRYCDIALIFRGIGQHKQLIPAIFADYQIPVAIHEGEPLENNSLIKFISNMLTLLSGEGDTGSLLSFLTSAHLEVPIEKISKIKQDLDAKPWSGSLKQLELSMLIPEINMLKEAAVILEDIRSAKQINEVILRLIKELVPLGTLLEVTGSMFNQLTSQSANRQTEDISAFKKLQSLLNEIERLDETGFDSSMLPQTYFDLVREGINGALFTVHDPHPDRVQVYDCRLMQQKEYKVVFVCDLVEKAFPARAKEDSFFKDDERKLFNCTANTRLKLKLEDADKEHILYYLAVTRASEQLYMCYYRYDEGGRETLPSYYIKQVEKLFAPGTIPHITEADGVDEIACEEELLQWMLAAGTKGLNKEALYSQIYNYILAHYPDRLRCIGDKVFRYGKTDYLDPAIVDVLNNQRGAYSISTLEAYAGCPYQYFGKYVLKVQPAAFGFTALEKGNLLHGVLEKFQAGLIKREQTAGADDLTQLVDTFRELFAPWREKIHPEYIMYKTEQELLKQLKQFLDAEIEFQTASPFKPAELEKEFYFKLNGQITLRGRIDRVDRDRDNILLIDYKSGSVNLRPADIEKGKSLQLPVYAMAMQNEGSGQITGLELYSIKDTMRKGLYVESPTLANIGYKSTRNKPLGQEEFNTMLGTVQGHIKQYVSEIEKGKITCTPMDNECGPYCDFANVCRVNKWEISS
ncbi:PD-(D/E)XK nuclease family protein [Candidatus Margulisiibacteriota bacterium]